MRELREETQGGGRISCDEYFVGSILGDCIGHLLVIY